MTTVPYNTAFTLEGQATLQLTAEGGMLPVEITIKGGAESFAQLEKLFYAGGVDISTMVLMGYEGEQPKFYQVAEDGTRRAVVGGKAPVLKPVTVAATAPISAPTATASTISDDRKEAAYRSLVNDTTEALVTQLAREKMQGWSFANLCANKNRGIVQAYKVAPGDVLDILELFVAGDQIRRVKSTRQDSPRFQFLSGTTELTIRAAAEEICTGAGGYPSAETAFTNDIADQLIELSKEIKATEPKTASGPILRQLQFNTPKRDTDRRVKVISGAEVTGLVRELWYVISNNQNMWLRFKVGQAIAMLKGKYTEFEVVSALEVLGYDRHVEGNSVFFYNQFANPKAVGYKALNDDLKRHLMSATGENHPHVFVHEMLKK